jgi:hypothetical protein
MRKISNAWWAILLGVLAFLFVTGGKILQPTYTDWLMDRDAATHWLGWQFFRSSAFLQWPLGANSSYGLDIGSSIVFTDSIPLLAFIFKPLSALLPDTFQYFGLWVLICFSLQSLFAWKVLSLFTKDKWLPLVGSVFFAFAPACLWRLHLHYALFGQWVLLAALYFYFSKNFSIVRWIALLAATALIHAYLLAMVLTIWLADLIQRRWLKQMDIAKAAGYFFAGGIVVTTVMWAAGYFMLAGSVETGGFGFYRMNLLSLIDPDDMWSRLLPDQRGGVGDIEGFNYLGLGMLGLGLVAGYAFLRNTRIGCEVKIMPILIVSIGFFLYAISNHIAAGSVELFSYGLPPIIQHFADTFRVSGRFFWPVYYVIYLAIFYFLFTRLRRNSALSLCVAMLFVQAVDSADAWRFFRNKFLHPPAWTSPMRSPVWNDFSQQYRKLILVLPQNSPVNWMALSQFAAMHRMAINTGYFARINPEKERDAQAHITSSIVNNELSADSLYVFENDALWNIASSQTAPSDIAGVLDGFRIVAPKLRECGTCNTHAIASISIDESHDFDYHMERISFTSGGSGRKYQVYGWSATEKWGTWSDGDTALVLLSLPGVPKSDLNLLIDGHAFLTDKHPSQEVGIVVNNHPVGTLKYDQQSNGGVRVVNIPVLLASEMGGKLSIKFNFKKLKSPAELGLSADGRRLGLGIVSLELKTEN